MPNEKKKKQKQSSVSELYKIDGDKIAPKNKSCPKCGAGVFLAQHENRESCGKCGYTVFKSSVKK